MSALSDELRKELIESGAPSAELIGVLRAGGPVSTVSPLPLSSSPARLTA
jgi:hypothetical protein